MFKGYRTILFNIIATLPVLLDILASSEFREIIPLEYVPYYSLGILLVNIWLRSKTTTPIGRKE